MDYNCNTNKKTLWLQKLRIVKDFMAQDCALSGCYHIADLRSISFIQVKAVHIAPSAYHCLCLFSLSFVLREPPYFLPTFAIQYILESSDTAPHSYHHHNQACGMYERKALVENELKWQIIIVSNAMHISPLAQKPSGLQWATMQTHSKIRKGKY